MTERKEERRKKIIVKGTFHIKYVTWIIVFTAVIFGLITLMVCYLVYQNYQALDIISPEAMNQIESLNKKFLAGMIIIEILVAIAIGIVATMITHRFAGPVYNMKNRLKELSEGNLATIIKLREGDHLQDLAESLNSFISFVRSSFENDVSSYDKMIGHLESSKQDKSKDTIKLINELKEEKQKMLQGDMEPESPA